MCATCGCETESLTHDHADGHKHTHGHGHDHAHAHAHEHDDGHDHATVDRPRAVLEKNDRIAERNRGYLEAKRILALNLVSSPGSGKTTLLERTVRHYASRRGSQDAKHEGRDVPSVLVIEGDQATSRDADRIVAAGARAFQVNTGAGCHLDASMVSRALTSLDPPVGSLLAIENVGNLVCPALFDLGERAKVVVASVTEGDDKPLKYPHMFRASRLVLLNKIDLLPYVDFEVERFVASAREVNASIEVMVLSATRGDGTDAWYAWLDERLGSLEMPHEGEYGR